ncbi:hybrid sensor histidine kinase/response regulator [Myxococcota bacterium]|nr:hybrid sensor histidine kinase/response regulator [Myxococcota bacterium]MBU1429305.1 hybrid sensor histidine kinase/response regulator [Myxococcota bacterium]MBU1899309.1 hybrid sensor histidine kinase/response regulator [Myxococcota bacterium]
MMEPLRILIVDDELGMRRGVMRALRGFCVEIPEHGEFSFQAHEADSAEVALDHLGAERTDLMLLDVKLPGMTGLEMLKSLNPAEDPLVVMITGYATIPTAITATKRGAYDVLAKPFTPEEVRAVVRRATKHLIARRHAARLERERRQVRFEFISVLAHELKAPLAAIEGHLNLLQDRTLGDDLSAYLRLVERMLTRSAGMRKLIYDLLDLTGLESGRKQRTLTDLDLREVAEMSIETMKPTATPRGIEIHLHAPATVPLRADRGELDIALNNLISNAVKYNRDGGRVDVHIAPVEGGVTLTVKDTGIGMSPEEVAKLFGEFVRIKTQQTRGIDGSGLGLSILKKIAQLYDGDVRVESAPDVGSAFTLTLKSATA